MKAKTGKTVWEDRYESKLTQPVSEWGHGPNSTPLIVGDRLCGIGTNAVVRCLDKTTGKLLWTRDLRTDFASPHIDGVGYSTSPIAYKNTLIIPLGHRRDKGPVNVASDDGPSPPPGDDARDGRGIAIAQWAAPKLWRSILRPTVGQLVGLDGKVARRPAPLRP